MANLNRREFIINGGIGLGLAMASGGLLNTIASGNSINETSPVGELFGLTQEELKKLLEIALSKGGDFADFYFERTINDSVTMSEDIIKSSAESISLGVGIRVIKGQQIGFAYTNDLTFNKIKETTLTAAAIALGSAKAIIANLNIIKPKNNIYGMKNIIADMKLNPKIDLIKEAYTTAKNYNSKITKVSVSLADELQQIMIVNTEGIIVHDTRPQARLVTVATAENNGKRSTGFGNAGGRIGFDYFLNVAKAKDIGKKAAEEAIILLDAKDAPAGEQVVVLAKDQSGVMIHEAVGHPLEADANWKKTSIMWDKMGQMVAKPIVTIHDDATIPNYRGSLNIDDEGIETEDVMLIKNGKLVGLMHDRLSAKIMKTKSNGHGRRESYMSPPIPRMNNTILDNGDSNPDDIIKSVKKGFYAVTYQGGQVSGTGKFTFSVNLGYLIEDGKLTSPLKNATLIGTNVQILKEVSMVGNDMGFFLGTCGKDGQSVPVTCGTPTLKIDKMTVGGIA